jgi:hypothetical protein
MSGIDILIIDYKKKQLEGLNKAMKNAGLHPAVWVPEEWLERVKAYFDGGIEILGNDDERKFSRIWAHTSTPRWDITVKDKAADQCFLTLYTSGDGIENRDRDKVELNLKFNEVTNILTLLDNEPSFVQALSKYREQPDKPFSIKTAIDKEIAMALAILCQGYLAAFAANRSQIEHVLTDWLTNALSQMGWTNLPENNASVLRGILKGKFDEVQKPLWWLEPFGLLPDKDGIEDPSWLPFKKQIEQEWRLNSFDEAPSILQSILGRIKNNQAPSSPSEVAQLYCELVDFLGDDSASRNS